MRLTNTAEANAALEELISQKLRKGYVVAKRPAAPKPRRRTKGDGTLIARLEAWLLANRPTYLKQLKKGADAKDIEKLERAVGATVPAAFKAFLAWRNGQSGSCWSALVGNRAFMPIADIVSSRRTLGKLLEAGQFDRANWWSTKWVPFLAANEIDLLVIDLEGTFTGKKGQVLEFWHDETWRTIVHASFDDWLRTFVEALEAGLYHVEYDDGEEGELEVKRPAELAKLTKKLNPGYPIKKNASRL